MYLVLTLDISQRLFFEYSKTNIQKINAGIYQVLAQDTEKMLWFESNKVQVEVVDHLSIKTQPVGRTINTGESVTFSVLATGGKPPYFYLWKKNGVDLTWMTNQKITFTKVKSENAGSYTVLVTDSNTTRENILSSTANLVVTENEPTPDLTTHDGDWESGKLIYGMSLFNDCKNWYVFTQDNGKPSLFNLSFGLPKVYELDAGGIRKYNTKDVVFGMKYYGTYSQYNIIDSYNIWRLNATHTNNVPSALLYGTYSLVYLYNQGTLDLKPQFKIFNYRNTSATFSVSKDDNWEYRKVNETNLETLDGEFKGVVTTLISASKGFVYDVNQGNVQTWILKPFSGLERKFPILSLDKVKLRTVKGFIHFDTFISGRYEYTNIETSEESEPIYIFNGEVI
jgi:hypothetical protein